jgi:hypothetical protein
MNPDFSVEDIGTAEAEQKSALHDSAEDPEISLSDMKK